MVAGEGDLVAMGGGEMGSNGPWRVCPAGSIEVIGSEAGEST
jgi:hypothetical protein